VSIVASISQALTSSQTLTFIVFITQEVNGEIEVSIEDVVFQTSFRSSTKGFFSIVVVSTYFGFTSSVTTSSVFEQEAKIKLRSKIEVNIFFIS
jgi:hypothetical protein